MEEMELFEAMYSQRQITRFKPDPVPQKAIEKIIEAATKAPSGGNRQQWEFMVITEPDLISRIGHIYREEWVSRLGAEPRPGESPVYGSARYLANHMHETPALILICVDHSKGSAYTPGQPIARGALASSIWLAIQNLFLAARALGLGTRITTAYLSKEREIKDLLGIPEHVETVCLTPLGYPRVRFGPTDRVPAA